ncbi:MAG: amidohydrolase family protein [Gemmatimonadota bacterium]
MLRNVTVVDVETGALRPGMDVTVTDGRIYSVEPRSAEPVPRGASASVDGGGRFLIPGLWDMHGHVLPASETAGDAWWEPDPETAFRLLVANGVTGVRDMWGSLEARARVERERRSRGRPWPRLLTPGGIVDGPVPYYPGLISVASPDEARAAVDSLAAGGADFVKVYTSLPPDLLGAVVARARERGLAVAGHVPASVSAGAAARAGMRSFEHLYGVLEGCSSAESSLLADNVSFLDARAAGRNTTREDRAWFERLLGTQDEGRCEALLRLLAREGTFQVPTLAALEGVFRLRDAFAADDPRLAYVDPRARAFWGPSTYDESRSFADADWDLRRRRLDRMREVIARMAEFGVPILAGSDFHPTIAFTFPGFSLHDELALLVASGLTPLQALRTATLEPARYLAATDSLGSVAPGRVADLVLLEGNPLADIAAAGLIHGVVLGGRWLPRDTLDAWLADVAGAGRGPAPPPLAELPPGAERRVELAGVRAGLRLVFLLEPSLARGRVPEFLAPLRAEDLAGSSPPIDALLRANPQYRGWLVSGLEIVVADRVRVDGSGPRRGASARWWLEATPGDRGPQLPGPPDASVRVQLGEWGTGTGHDARIEARQFPSGTWSFRIEDLSVRADFVCAPGGARSPFGADATGGAILWEGDRVPERYSVELSGGRAARECDLRVSADGLHPLTTALARAPVLRGPALGARLVEGGRVVLALYRVD